MAPAFAGFKLNELLVLEISGVLGIQSEDLNVTKLCNSIKEECRATDLNFGLRVPDLSGI